MSDVSLEYRGGCTFAARRARSWIGLPSADFRKSASWLASAGTTIWHSGLGVPYVDLADRLRPYSVNVAIVTIGDETFNEVETADLVRLRNRQERRTDSWSICWAIGHPSGSKFFIAGNLGISRRNVTRIFA